MVYSQGAHSVVSSSPSSDKFTSCVSRCSPSVVYVDMDRTLIDLSLAFGYKQNAAEL